MMYCVFFISIVVLSFVSTLHSEDKLDKNLDYLISPYDVLDVKVFQEPDLNKQVRVEATGFIFLPLIGKVEVAGLSLLEVQKKIEDLYEEDFLVDAHLNIFVLERKTNTIRVFGQVARQGDVSIKPDRPLTILDAISAAGGGTRLADLSKVILTRFNPENRKNPEIINVEMLMDGENKSKNNCVLEVGDTIFVPERFF